ncbi:MAG: OmpA family protein [Candidatus Azobacteroides sp.]|nr:OmpA family protein [Candidatus Azobacteroides sp.]
MEQIYDSLKALLNQDMIAKAAKVVEENDSNVSTASNSIIAGLLGVMLKNGVTPQLREIFEEAGNQNILADVKNICNEKITKDQQRVGDNFLQHLLGDKAANFTNPIAEKAGITKVATNRLVAILAPVVAGYFGNKMTKENWSLHQILNRIGEQKSSFMGNIPNGIIDSFGLSSVLNKDYTTRKVDNTPEEPRKKSNWWMWLLLLLLLLLFFFLWRSCRDHDKEPREYYESETVTVVDTVPDNNYVENTDNRDLKEITLPDGTKINVYDGGVEEKMLDYLKSDDYKNASADDLKKKWFDLDDVRFEFGSTSNLLSGSQRQLDNIIAILKNYPDSKIKLGGYADKVGSDEVNMKISADRAKTVESLLENGGLKNQIVKTEGYGDEYAEHNASESNSARSEDRSVALRFVK